MKKTQTKNSTVYFALLALLCAGSIFRTSATAQTTATLNFSGLQNSEEVREFYNGGAGSLGSTGGTNYGISFVNNYISAASGQVETAFTTPQLRNTIRGVTINVPNGFGTAVSFRYKRPLDGNGADFCFVRAMSGLTLGGTELGRLSLPETGAGGGFNTATSPLTNFTFAGTARSLEFRCGGDHMAIDDITFSTSSNPTTNNPALRYADFDGDAKTDVSVFRSGTWFVNASSNTSASFGVQFGQQGDIVVPVDFDGDGRSDIAVWRGAAFANFLILNSSNNTFRAAQFGTTGDNPTVSGDWDADGRADLAVYRGASTSGGQSFFYYRPSSQPNVDFIPIQWGTSGDTAIFGDFDGDRKLDPAVYRPSNSTYYVRQSSNSAALIRQWGVAATDAIFAGDFDGDGKSDFAVQRFSGTDAGTWYVAQSGGTNRAFVWGTGSDVPVPADYDGDGKMDVAVYRRLARTWYVLQSASNTPFAITFGASGDLPLPLILVR